jgi:hypothetical protein
MGWLPVIPIYINFILLSLSIFLFLWITKLDAGQIIFAGFAIILNWPVLLFLPLTTHETLNQAIGILITIMIIWLLPNRKRVGYWSKLGIILFVYFATLIRLSWGLLLIPMLFYCINGKLVWRGLLSILLGGGLYLSVVLLMSYFLPPLNNSILRGFTSGISEGPRIFLDLIYMQFAYMFQPKQFTPNILVMFEMLIVIGWSLYRLMHFARSNKPNILSILDSPEMFNVYNMVSLGLAGLTFYLYEAFYRTFAPAMLIVYLLQVARKDYKFLSALLVVNVLFFSAYMTYHYGIGDYQIVRTNYTTGIPHGSQIRSEVEKHIIYVPSAKSPWCNTLLIPLRYYDSRLTLIPPGIGVSYILDPETYQLPIKSRYILFDQETYDMYKDRVDLELLVTLPIGDLYRNRDVDCSTIRQNRINFQLRKLRGQSPYPYRSR